MIDLHNHTVRCNHATGSIDAYIQKAVACGTDVLGFSDHAPMDFDPRYRMDFDEMAAYEADIRSAKARYAGTIEILLGYEVDYLPGLIDPRVLRANVDYLIGSVHFIGQWGFDNPEFIGRYEGSDIDAVWSDYFSLVEKMAESGLFDIVGHLDLIKIFKFLPKRDIRLIAAPAMRAIKRADMVLEINAAGFRKPIGEAYPSRRLLEMAFELDIPVTFGSDAHAPDQVGLNLERVIALAREVGYRQAAVFSQRDRKLINF